MKIIPGNKIILTKNIRIHEAYILEFPSQSSWILTCNFYNKGEGYYITTNANILNMFLGIFLKKKKIPYEEGDWSSIKIDEKYILITE